MTHATATAKTAVSMAAVSRLVTDVLLRLVLLLVVLAVLLLLAAPALPASASLRPHNTPSLENTASDRSTILFSLWFLSTNVWRSDLKIRS
jgi:hypothetical protein